MKKLIQHIWIFVVCMCMLCNAGCTRERSRIAYTIYPLGYIIARLAEDTIQYQSIQKEDITVQASNITDNYENILKNSQVLFHIGTLEPYIGVFRKKISETGVEDGDLSGKNAIYDFARYTQVSDSDGTTKYEETPYYEGAVFDAIDTDKKDLAIWNDPIEMLSMTKDIYNWLVTNYPDQKDVYHKNYKALEEDLINVDASYQNFAKKLHDDNKKVSFVSMTTSFGCWQKAYGFEVYPVVLSRYGALPNKEQLAGIEERIKADHVTYIAKEGNLSDDMNDLYEQVKNDCNLTEIPLSNLSSLSDDESKAGKDYLSVMYENLTALETMSGEEE